MNTLKTIIKINSSDLQNFLKTLDCVDGKIQETDTFEELKFICVEFKDVSEYECFMDLLECVIVKK